MFLVQTFPRSSFSVHSLGLSSLTGYLLSFTLFFLVSSYTIDDSCQNYAGTNITGDIQQAINEVQEMAANAFTAILRGEERTNHLLVTLFGWDRRGHTMVADYFARIATFSPTEDFVVICDDQRVQREVDTYQETPDPLGVWIDHRYEWLLGFNEFKPCGRASISRVTSYAYSMFGRLIYLCPNVLDKPLGRSIAPYKDQLLTGLWIDDYICLPVVLFHEILHTHSFSRKSSSRW